MVTDHPYQYALQPVSTVPLPTRAFHLSAIFPFRPPPSQRTPLTYTDVYLDDFMLLTQDPTPSHASNKLLTHMSTIFNEPTDSPRRAVVSQSKVLKGDATFTTSKCILGWEIDSATMTISLPPHRVDRLRELLQDALSRTHTTRLKWQRLLANSAA